MCNRCNVLQVLNENGQEVGQDIKDLVYLTANLMAQHVQPGSEMPLAQGVLNSLGHEYAAALERRAAHSPTVDIRTSGVAH